MDIFLTGLFILSICEEDLFFLNDNVSHTFNNFTFIYTYFHHIVVQDIYSQAASG